MHIIPQPARNVNMRKLQIKRSNALIEPANPSTHTPSTPAKSTVLEIIGEIVCLTAILTLGWIAYVVF